MAGGNIYESRVVVIVKVSTIVGQLLQLPAARVLGRPLPWAEVSQFFKETVR